MNDKKLGLISALAVVAVAAAMFLPLLGSITLFDVDEPRFADAARVMRDTGNYLVPCFNGQVRYEKPPLVYWVMICGYNAFGVNEFGARIGSALAGIASCLVIFLIANGMFGRRAALISGIMAATTLLIFMESRIATADALLMLTILLMFLGFRRVHNGKKSFASYALLYGGLAAGSLDKGPVPLAVLLATTAIYAMLRRDYPGGSSPGTRLHLWLHELWLVARDMRLLAGVGAAVVIVLLWFVPAVIATKGGFLTQGLLKQVGERAFVRSFEGHSGIPIVHYLVILPLTFFPWFAVLPESIRLLWNNEEREHRAFLLAWAIAPFLIFSFLKTKLFHYTLPAYPAFAIICGAALGSALSRRHSFWKHWLGKAGIITFVVVGLGMTAGMILFPLIARWHELFSAMISAAAAMLVLTGWALFLFLRHKTDKAFVTLAILTAATLYVTMAMTVTAFNNTPLCKGLAREIAQIVQPGDQVVRIDFDEPSMVFYLARTLPAVDDQAGLERLLQQNRRLVCITSASGRDIPRKAGGTRIKDVRYLSIKNMKWKDMSIWRVERAAP